jgi:hypothetical protein
LSVFITTPHEWIEDLIKSLVTASQGSIELSSDNLDDLTFLGEAAGMFLIWGYQQINDLSGLAGTLDDIVDGFNLTDFNYDVLYQYFLDLLQFHHGTLCHCLESQEISYSEPIIAPSRLGWRLVGWYLA